MTKEEKDLKYYQYMEELLRVMTQLKELDINALNKVLGKICVLYNISKGVTSFYNSIQYEQQGVGEHFVCYDSGEPSHVIEKIRYVTAAMTVVVCEVFQADGAEEIPSEDKDKVILTMQTILSLVSRHRLQKIVERLTFYDDFGYPNMNYYQRALAGMLENHELKDKVAIHFNLKHYTMTNQNIGRANGDIAMRNYFDEIQKASGEDGIVCRLGGDNFIMIFNKEHLHDVILILSGMDVIYDVNDGTKTRISASAGIYEIPDDYDEGMDGIIDKILTCSNTARKDNNTDIIFYNKKMADNRKRAMYIEQILPEAMKNEEFLVYYQPKVDVNTGELIGAEALCRWSHDGQLISPNDFIPIMEQSLDICKLDFYMLDHVCRDIKRWLEEGKTVVRVSVNLSRKHMIDNDLLEHIVSIVDKHQIPHKYIEIELTETTTDVEFRDLKRVVNGLQMAGIYTSVDDFGTGYSSLNLIKEISWNVLKVDRSLLPVDVENQNSVSSIMFKYVIAMAKALGLECISEGVETRNQLDVLKENHCDLAQGFYFDKPLPVDDFEDRLKIHKYKVS